MGLGQGPIGKDRMATFAISRMFVKIHNEERNRTTARCKICGLKLPKGAAREIKIGGAAMYSPGRYFICDECRVLVEEAWAACPDP